MSHRHALRVATGPSIASVRVHNALRARAETVAASALDSVLREHTDDASGRGVAHRFGVDERMVRDYRDGSRNIPLAFVLSLPPTVAVEVLRACLAEVELLSSGLPVDRAHRQIVARVGALSADLDAALADDVLTDDERRGLASSLRQLGLRCEQAARDLSAVGE